MEKGHLPRDPGKISWTPYMSTYHPSTPPTPLTPLVVGVACGVGGWGKPVFVEVRGMLCTKSL
eukprot:578218-Prymnesium_polylepis.1